MEVSQNIFNALSAWAKIKEESKAAELKQVFIAELSKINDHLLSNGDPMLCVFEVSEMPGSKAYTDYVFNSEPFKRTGYPEEYIYLGGMGKIFFIVDRLDIEIKNVL